MVLLRFSFAVQVNQPVEKMLFVCFFFHFWESRMESTKNCYKNTLKIHYEVSNRWNSEARVQMVECLCVIHCHQRHYFVCISYVLRTILTFLSCQKTALVFVLDNGAIVCRRESATSSNSSNVPEHSIDFE